MRRLGRLISGLIRLVAVLVSLVIVALVVMVAITTQRGWAQTAGTIVVPGLQRDVRVARDNAGVIQITADTPRDLFFAQGYVHAQERMWQMEISRRIGAGRLSELFGKGQVDRDKYIRTFGWRQAAERDLAAMAPETLAILQAYADGVNAWIDQHDGQLSTSFVVAGLRSGTGGIGGITLEPWTPLDSATWQKVQAWSLGGNVDSEVFRLLADTRLGGAAATDELFPPYAPDMPVITPSGLAGSGGAGARGGKGGATGRARGASPAIALDADDGAALAALAEQSGAIVAMAGFDRGAGLVGSHGVGSNNWVISGERSASGQPILANDPHLGFGMPSVWILNGLHCSTVFEGCPWDVVGASFPGAPAVVLGHNARIAWGATNVNPDTQDLFVETPDTTDPAGHYIYQGRSVAYEVRHEVINVGGGAPVEFDVRSTRHGPVLSDVDKRLADGPILSMRWTTTAETDLALEAFFKVNLAASFDEFRAAFDGYGSPSQNFIYADVDGHIGYVLPGLIPLREGATGERVRDGASGSAEWTGYVSREDLPWQLDPETGQIVSANNAPVDAQFPYWLGNEWDPGYRAARITELLDSGPPKLTADDMRTIEMDTFVPRARAIVAAVRALVPKVATADGGMLVQQLLTWDGTCGVDSRGCAAYMTVELALQRAIFDDELGDLAREWVGSTMAWEALRNVLQDPSSHWWAGAGGAAADPGQVAGAAIDAIAAELRAAHDAPEQWTWGAIHTVQFKEGTLGSSGILPLEWYFDSKARPVGGADGAIQNNYYRLSRVYADPADDGYVPLANVEAFSVTNGPSLRLTIDMGDVDGARAIITTGQSGNPFDRHYADMIALWADGQTVPLPIAPGLVGATTVETLILTPR